MVPSSFKLMGITYQVVIVNEKDWIDDDSNGFCNFQNHLIQIRGSLSPIHQQQTFCHELVHAILQKMGEDKLNGDEQFVDVFGSLLHQSWTSIGPAKASRKAK